MNELKRQRRSFTTQLTARPGDFALRLVYGDWLEEQGHFWMANCQRYMVRHRIYPATNACDNKDVFYSAMTYKSMEFLARWPWWSMERDGSGLALHSRLPARLINVIPTKDRWPEVGWPFDMRFYLSRHSAELALAGALKKTGEIVSGEEAEMSLD